MFLDVKYELAVQWHLLSTPKGLKTSALEYIYVEFFGYVDRQRVMRKLHDCIGDVLILTDSEMFSNQ